MKAKMVLGVCLAVFPLIAFSAMPIYIKIKNKTNFDAYVMMADNYSWRCADLCKEQFVRAHSTSKFYTDANLYFATLQTLNIRYGTTVAKVELWVNSDHNLDENVKTAIVRLSQQEGDSTSRVYADIVGVGTDSENIQTAVYPENMWKGSSGPTNIVLAIN